MCAFKRECMVIPMQGLWHRNSWNKVSKPKNTTTKATSTQSPWSSTGKPTCLPSASMILVSIMLDKCMPMIYSKHSRSTFKLPGTGMAKAISVSSYGVITTALSTSPCLKPVRRQENDFIIINPPNSKTNISQHRMHIRHQTTIDQKCNHIVAY